MTDVMSYLQLHLGWLPQSCCTIAVTELAVWEGWDVAACNNKVILDALVCIDNKAQA